MKLAKKIMIFWACLIFAFTSLFIVPQQKAHAIAPLIIGQYLKKSATKAMAGMLVRQGAKASTKKTMQNVANAAGSRLSPQMYTNFTDALRAAQKSKDNKWLKVIVGAELMGAIGLLAGDMADIAEGGGMIDFNTDFSSGTGATWGEAMGIAGTTIDNPAKFFTGGLHLDYAGFHMRGEINGTSWYLYLTTHVTGFDSTNPATLDDKFGTDGDFRRWPMGFTNQNPTPNFRLLYITGITAYEQTPGGTIRVNVFGQTENGTIEAPGYDSYLNPSNGQPGNLYMDYATISQTEWNKYYNDILLKDYQVDHAQIGDYDLDETFIQTNPLEETENGSQKYAVQVPNPDYWDLPGMEDAYYDQLQQFPKESTVPDPTNYEEPATDPGTGTEPLPPATGTVPTNPPGTEPGTPYIPAGEGCTQALKVPRFLPLVNTLSESFPFSIPFDLYDGFQALFSEMGSSRPNFKYDVNFNGNTQTWDITIPAYFDEWKPFTDSMLIFIFDIGIIYAFFRFMKGGQ